MEQLDKEVIEELSEPAKRVFRSLDYRSQRRMLKKAKEMGKQKRRKTQQKERIKKKSITKKQKKNVNAPKQGVVISSPMCVNLSENKFSGGTHERKKNNHMGRADPCLPE